MTGKRLPYARPTLRRYGPITKLVQGAGGSKGDGGSFTRD